MIKLNVGCGTDYREGFINIDGSDSLNRVDKVVDLNKDSLLVHFDIESVDSILANDIVEHHFHWEAVKLMTDFYKLLRVGGICEIRVPDAEYIIKAWRIPIEKKLVLLFGGQDMPQYVDSEMDESRKQFPQFFCHKYGWTMQRLKKDLNLIGFKSVKMKRSDTNFIAIASK